jgi:hypothetical protein
MAHWCEVSLEEHQGAADVDGDTTARTTSGAIFDVSSVSSSFSSSEWPPREKPASTGKEPRDIPRRRRRLQEAEVLLT